MEHDLYIMVAKAIELGNRNNEILEALFAKLQEETDQKQPEAKAGKEVK